jgi:hypothetical protein
MLTLKAMMNFFKPDPTNQKLPLAYTLNAFAGRPNMDNSILRRSRILIDTAVNAIINDMPASYHQRCNTAIKLIKLLRETVVTGHVHCVMPRRRKQFNDAGGALFSALSAKRRKKFFV